MASRSRFRIVGPIQASMQRLDPFRQEARSQTSQAFASRRPTPVFLLRFVVEGELTQNERGPEGTMRHSKRRTLASRLAAPTAPGRRKVDVERLAGVRYVNDSSIAGTYLIGRDRRCDVVLNDYTISAEHARLHYVAQIRRWMIEDLDSTNCTFQNGGELPPNERALLTSLDELQLGRMVFLYMEPTDLHAYLTGEY